MSRTAPQCTATSKRTGERCKANAMRGRSTCYHHGGKSPVGAALPQFKHGRYSKFLPARIAATYEESLKDTQLLELNDHIAVMEGRLVDLFKRADTGEAGAIWQQTKQAFDDLQTGMQAQNKEQIATSLGQLRALIARGNSDYATWHEIGSVMGQLIRLKESQRKRESDLETSLKLDRLMLLTGAMLEILRRHSAAIPSEYATPFLSAVTLDMQVLLERTRPADE